MITSTGQTPMLTAGQQVVRVAVADLQVGNVIVYDSGARTPVQVLDETPSGRTDPSPVIPGYRWLNTTMRPLRTYCDVLLDTLTQAQRDAFKIDHEAASADYKMGG